jgi:hypothetical protein
MQKQSSIRLFYNVLVLFSLLAASFPSAAGLAVKPEAITINAGQSGTLSVLEPSGAVTVSSGNTKVATATYSAATRTVTVTGVAAGTTNVTVRDSQEAKSASVTVRSSGGGNTGASYAVFAVNDLGMHCSDQDFQIFSILPPFNVAHAQVIQKGTSTANPKLLTGNDVDVYYVGVANPNDPAGAGSINTTSQNQPSVFKTNFWRKTTNPDGTTSTLGGAAYRQLYPSTAALGLCSSTPCQSVLDLFEPIPPDLGLPVPDPAKLPDLAAGQQPMPSASNLNPFVTAPYMLNQPQRFDRFDGTLPFFASFPFGTTVTDANWFAADGIPILPVDDQGRSNAYPMVKVQAVPKGKSPDTTTTLAAVDIVLPVASEADCQSCHADASDFGNGRAANFASVTKYANGKPWRIALAASSPGPQSLLNAAKINILRLHDAKHGASYTSSATGAATPCTSGTEASCLDKRRRIQCSQCHYSPALDLAQAGPLDETQMGEAGRQQTRHISMSRAMHEHHGQFSDLFPEMPAPNSPQRTPDTVASVLEQTCYACHPGKQTKCLRGAMASGGVVCQDCHGNMKQVGNDFTGGFPTGQGADLTKRVPWANEPKCQSCHIGDAVSVASMNLSDFIVAADGIRLLQAYRVSDASKASLPLNTSPTSRFAENQPLYRLSKGHGGVKCENCHGSTHAEWPVGNANANDNVTATQLQGHSGTIIECTVCHASGSLAANLNGPHGMHPVDDRNWILKHESLAENNAQSCRTCHGNRGQGTALSRAAADRTLARNESGGTVSVKKGTQISCGTCHSNPL